MRACVRACVRACLPACRLWLCVGLNFYVLKEDVYPIEHETDVSAGACLIAIVRPCYVSFCVRLHCFVCVRVCVCACECVRACVCVFVRV